MSATTHRRPGETFAGYTQLEAITCYRCGIPFALPAHMLAKAREHGDFEISFHCPNGHSQGFGKSEADKAKERERLASERASAERARREQAEASERAQRAAATRARNERDKVRRRVANGVCPCCGRTFKQLARHMASQHPDYVEDAAAPHR